MENSSLAQNIRESSVSKETTSDDCDNVKTLFQKNAECFGLTFSLERYCDDDSSRDFISDDDIIRWKEKIEKLFDVQKSL